jgi:hypothetical protein
MLGLSAALALPAHAASNNIAASKFRVRQLKSIYFLLIENLAIDRSDFEYLF